MSTSDTLPKSVRYCIIGAGIHGLSTAWHLARELKARGTGDGSDIVVIEKSEAVPAPRASPAAWFATTISSPPCGS